MNMNKTEVNSVGTVAEEVHGLIPSTDRYDFALVVQFIDTIGLFHLNILVWIITIAW